MVPSGTMSFEASLSKIRPHTSSSLAHQKAPANLLVALDSTLRDQGTERSPTAYFAALLTTLESSQSKVSFGDGDLLPAILYLFALVAPHLPPAVIRSHLSTLLSLLSPLFPALVPHAPPLRSHLSLFSAIIQALDASQLDTPGIRQTFTFILELTLDPRPKVRKKAAELVRDVLANPPTPLVRHPYAERVGAWASASLTTVGSGVGSFGRQAKKAEGNDAPEVGIHLIAMIKPTVSYLPSSQLPGLAQTLLSLPRLGNPYLSQSSYNLLSNLISDQTSTSDMTSLISVLLSSAPSKSDAAQTPAWLDLLGTAFSFGPAVFLAENNLDAVFKSVFSYLEATDVTIRAGASLALTALVSKCITLPMVEAAATEGSHKKPKSPVGKILAHVRMSLETLSYARAMPQMLAVLASLLLALRSRPKVSTGFQLTAAEVLLLDVVQKIGELRVKKSFEHKEAADEVLKAAMSVLGPEVIFRVLPLGLIPEDRTAGREPHAHLLPLLAIPHPAPLGHFVAYFVPLSERMFDLHQKADAEGRANEAKMWDVLIAQIWTGLVGYCWGTRDLTQAFNTSFAQLLSQILYNQPQLRPAVLKALKTVVESNVALMSDTRPGWATSDTISAAEACQNIDHLKGQAESWFAVLFNVFGSVGQESKGVVGDVISAWAGIAGDSEVAKMYRKVVALFQQNLSNQPKNLAKPGGDNVQNVILTTQDLLVLLLPYLPLSECKELWGVCASAAIIGNADGGIQKRGYRILSKLVQGGKLGAFLDAAAVLQQLAEGADSVGAAAKRDRTALLMLLLDSLPSTSLHLIPSLIPEAVLATKEPAERTRAAAFDLVVAMGRKMKDGGVVKRHRMDGMVGEDDPNAAEVQASIEEYMTMMAAGLAGATPHMISATVTAISRLVFEFKDDISPTMLDEILSTLLVFISSANREIVKSALGFIKLSVHTLPVEMVMPHLNQLVPALLNWSGDHKNHFKVKVRHIFERMIRRFGWEAVYHCVGNEAEEREKGKVLLNIKKRKDRAKRKKAKRADEGEEDVEEAPAVRKTGDAFEDVLYGSESEIEDSDDDDALPHADKTSRAATTKRQKGARLRLDDDEPMDLLHGAAEQLTNRSKNRRRKPGQDASHFKTDDSTGKMVIDGEDEDAHIAADGDVAGAAYKESLTSVDGFTRGANGRVKFNKDTKKRRRANEGEGEDGDVEMPDAIGLGPSKSNKKRKKEAKLGQEFKAKNAGGDVRKGGLDPYAYLPLSQAAKKGGKGGRVNVVGRR
ncbi:NUC173-domain-containing protein [Gautieria morchelliformis]|nr:NUC173-domain-containing protein [Gautieria morchelliformis]